MPTVLVFMQAVSVELGHEVSNNGAAAQHRHVQSHDGEHLDQEGLPEEEEEEENVNLCQVAWIKSNSYLALRLKASLMRKKFRLPGYLAICAPGTWDNGVTLIITFDLGMLLAVSV